MSGEYYIIHAIMKTSEMQIQCKTLQQTLTQMPLKSADNTKPPFMERECFSHVMTS